MAILFTQGLAFWNFLQYNCFDNSEGGAVVHIIGEFCIRTIADEIVALPVGSNVMNFSGILSLNEVGQFLFELLREDQTEESLTDALVAEFEVDRDTAAADVGEFLETLRSNKLLAE